MLFPKTVDGVLKKFIKAIEELQELAEEQGVAITQRERDIERLDNERTALMSEQSRALSVAGKMRAIIS